MFLYYNVKLYDFSTNNLNKNIKIIALILSENFGYICVILEVYSLIVLFVSNLGFSWKFLFSALWHLAEMYIQCSSGGIIGYENMRNRKINSSWWHWVSLIEKRHLRWTVKHEEASNRQRWSNGEGYFKLESAWILSIKSYAPAIVFVSSDSNSKPLDLKSYLLFPSLCL